ncbi:hypothetical protein BD324DRAFT_615920 [Kockovaella imperatae]|uniref:Uncharacterized protein n=1 Tax=Kockovaella imperatae TaxID=4999 RepID=A0A1Y1UPM2_9TREE|nr:hypothetical protein BD324DRAFT_615920 [Kockovaella imperatae]ORX40008.1 hypothetical protein BD324DRAFT_615920 [Kockovaella imperatae]
MTSLPSSWTNRMAALSTRRYLICLIVVLAVLFLTAVYNFGDSSYIGLGSSSSFRPADDYIIDPSESQRPPLPFYPLNPASPFSSSASSLYPPDKDLPRVFLFLPINSAGAHESPRFCRAIQGAIASGWQPIIFNWDVQEQYQKHKPFGLRDILNSPKYTAGIKEDDLIFMMDSWDVWLQLSPRVMARRFLEYDEDILVAAEKNCFPNSPESHDCRDVPASPVLPELYLEDENPHDLNPLELLPKHANSGTIIGRLHKMREFYNNLTQYMESEEYYWYDDQGAFNIWLADRKVKLDYYNRLFWPAHDDFHNMQFLGTRYPPDPSIFYDMVDDEGSEILPWSLYPPLGHHSLTGQIPIAIHFNGGSKEHLEYWWGKLWWSSDKSRFKPVVRRRMDQGKIRFVTETGYRQESIRSLCPELEIWSQAR